MAEPDSSPFGMLLKRCRMAAGLTQEELAERAQVSVRGISDLERGARHLPRRSTLRQLADGLSLRGDARERFESAAAGVLAGPGAEMDVGLVPEGDPRSIVGRAQEIAAIEEQLAGRGAPVLLLAGEPGIGKSRLLTEAARRASRAGFAVLAGGCQRRNGQAPYAPVRQAVERALATVPAQRHRSIMQGCSWLVRLLPELANDTNPLPTIGSLPLEQERRLVCSALRRFLANLAGAAGTLLLLDDLQWADPDTLDLMVELLAVPSEAQLSVVAAYRDTELVPGGPLYACMADLARERLARHIHVEPLPPDEATALLAAILSEGEAEAGWDDRLVQTIVRRTGGVPFFLSSCAEGVRTGTLRLEAPETLPWDLTHSLRQRLVVLRPETQVALEAAAIVGRTVPVALLMRVTDLAEPALLDALDEAARARILVPAGAGYRFAHDIIREVIDADVGPARRAVWHRRVADALELYAQPKPVEALAFHYASSGESEKAMMYIERAGDAARERQALTSAVAYYRDLVDRTRAAERPRDLARAQEKLGSALAAMGQYANAVDTFEAAIAAYRTLGDQAGESRAIAAMGALHFRYGAATKGIELVRAQLAIIAQHETPGAQRAEPGLWSALAALYFGTARYQESREAAERALRLGQGLGEQGVLGEAAMMRASSLAWMGHFDQAVSALDGVAQMLERAGPPEALAAALVMAGMVTTAQGDFARSGGYAERALSVAQACVDPALLAFLHGTVGLRLVYLGDWDGARTHLRRAVAAVTESGPSLLGVASFGHLGLLEGLQGHLDVATTWLRRGLSMADEISAAPMSRYLEARLAEIDLARGRFTEVRDRLQPVSEGLTLQWPHATLIYRTLAEAVLGLGDVARADTLVGRALREATTVGNRVDLVGALRVQGSVRVAQGRWQEASFELTQALELAQAMPFPHAEALVRMDYAALQEAQGNHARAEEMRAQAGQIFQRLGVVP